ncbi:MAG: M91 family zinc metallopeptidase, partial [Mesorhizobium sp.]|nr:M91 family zinc metallopeptidase [Mesorhizobium sp.]
ELVSGIVDSSKTTTVVFDSPGAATSSPPGQNPNTTPSDAIVKFDPAYHSVNAEFNPSTGAVTNVPKIPALVLGHELIHATHRNEGTRDVSVKKYNGMDGVERSNKVEEVRTVGLGFNKPNDITENQLREMLGVNPRNHY